MLSKMYVLIALLLLDLLAMWPLLASNLHPVKLLNPNTQDQEGIWQPPK